MAPNQSAVSLTVPFGGIFLNVPVTVVPQRIEGQARIGLEFLQCSNHHLESRILSRKVHGG